MENLVHQNVEEIAVVMPLIPQKRFEQLEDIFDPHGWVSVMWIISFLSVWKRLENVLRLPQERILAAHSGGYLGCLRKNAFLFGAASGSNVLCGPAGRPFRTTSRRGGPRTDFVPVAPLRTLPGADG